MKNKDLERARYASEKVKDVRENRSEYKSLVRSTPSMVINNGLGQTLGFLKSKNKKHHGYLYGHILEWFKKEGYIVNPKIDDVLKAEDEDYRLMTRESLVLLNWFKKIVVAEIVDEKGD